ncbi:hypothetical protein LCGC14_3144590 [marine sediment metagenome]|uniref:Head-tail adaptor protein n=1 Tax=marine sediment metagenome TaxID=412755 RepID=A0A0F8VW04_9ZZZZ
MARGIRVRAGKELRHPIDIERLTVTNRDDGGTDQVWMTLTPAGWWASVEPVSGDEFFMQGEQTEGRVTHRVTMRHFDGLTSKDRIIHKGRALNIAAVLDVEERGAKTVVMCREAT